MGIFGGVLGSNGKACGLSRLREGTESQLIMSFTGFGLKTSRASFAYNFTSSVSQTQLLCHANHAGR